MPILNTLAFSPRSTSPSTDNIRRVEGFFHFGSGMGFPSRAYARIYGGFRYFYFHPSLCLGMDLGMKWKRYGQNANA